MQKSLVKEFEPATTMVCTNSVATRKESGCYINCAKGYLFVSSWTIRLGLDRLRWEVGGYAHEYIRTMKQSTLKTIIPSYLTQAVKIITHLHFVFFQITYLRPLCTTFNIFIYNSPQKEH